MDQVIVKTIKNRLAKLQGKYKAEPTAELRNRIKECKKILELVEWEISLWRKI